MPASTEVTRLTRSVEALIEAVGLDLRPGSKTPMSIEERRRIKSSIQECARELDELCTRLTE